MHRPPWTYTHDELREILIDETFEPLLPPPADRAMWKKNADSACGRLVLDGIGEIAADAIPQSRATEYLAFWRTGDRATFEIAYDARRRNLARLLVAYCVSSDATLLDAITDYVWAICEETSWIQSAHLRNNGYSTELPSARVHQIDLGAAQTALLIAEVCHTLAGLLHPELTRRAVEELEIRVFQPYRYRNNFHWYDAEHNWNAVCNCSIIGAAVYAVRDEGELAVLLGKAFQGLIHYLAGFDEDGGVSEGILPWSFGFAHYCIASELVERRTAGRVSLVAGVPAIREIARFPIKLHLSGTMYVPFSDADESFNLVPSTNRYLNDVHAMNLPVVPFREFRNVNHIVRLYLSDRDDSVAEYPDRSCCDFFRGLGWMVSRLDPADPGTLTVAAKGGHNAEHHNHNDCGAFVIHYRGENLVAELGRDTFTRHMFDAGRYEILANRSEGHSVPVVNGEFQGTGREFAARLLDHSATDDHDTVAYDLAGAYPRTAGVTSLVRRVMLERTGTGLVRLTDTVELEEPGEVIETFWTFFEPVFDGRSIVISGSFGALTMAASIGGSAVVPSWERVPAAVRGTDAWRITFAVNPAPSAVVEAEFVPVDRTPA